MAYQFLCLIKVALLLGLPERRCRKDWLGVLFIVLSKVVRLVDLIRLRPFLFGLDVLLDLL